MRLELIGLFLILSSCSKLVQWSDNHPKLNDCYIDTATEGTPLLEIVKVIKINQNQLEYVYTFPMVSKFNHKFATTDSNDKSLVTDPVNVFLTHHRKTNCPDSYSSPQKDL